ncbi:endo alpha-1,4 polygalactosaminidase [Streptomyces sp. SCSIO ZS0520]|uniref:endo alpha-1,4 polygalactosaminidase n=1 Tax=Streptomyces sp. SCSIO ZS0520 TaxID=2892996 RepID=UPI003985CD8A
MRQPSARSRLTRTLAGTAAAVLLAACAPGAGTEEESAPALPPRNAGLDYQLGGAYPPPEGVGIVVRDHTARPAKGRYSICYVNAFQAQEGAESAWDEDLLLRDAKGGIVYDGPWNEAVLDIRTAEKRERIAAKVNGWIDTCARKGFQAVEPDNYDTFDRFGAYLSAGDAKALITLVSAHAHERGLAVAQKNTAELAPERERTGLDFAVAEECGAHRECGAYAEAFDDRVLVVEYEKAGLRRACAGWRDRLSIVLRDPDVSPAGDPGYVRETC